MLSRNYGSHFERAKTAIEEGGGRDELAEGYENQESDDSRPESIRAEDEKAPASVRIV